MSRREQDLFILPFIDVFARYIVDWWVSCLLGIDMVLDVLEQVLWFRKETKGSIHRSDRSGYYL